MLRTFFYRPHRSGSSLFLPPQPLWEIRKLTAKALRVKTSGLSEFTRKGFLDVEAGLGHYTWAFELQSDAEQLRKFTNSVHFKAYPKPKAMEEAGVDLLFQLFPKNCESVEKLPGQSVCYHPYIGPRAGPGSVQSEVPWSIARKDWLGLYGFGEGCLHLIKCLES